MDIDSFLNAEDYEIDDNLILVVNYDSYAYNTEMYSTETLNDIKDCDIKDIRVLYKYGHIITLRVGEFYNFNKKSLPLRLYFDILFILRIYLKYDDFKLKHYVTYK